MERVNHHLQVAIKFITELLFLRANASELAKRKVMGILGYEKESLELGWEEKIMINSSHFLNTRYNRTDGINFDKVQKIPLWIIAKVNNGEWN